MLDSCLEINSNVQISRLIIIIRACIDLYVSGDKS